MNGRTEIVEEGGCFWVIHPTAGGPQRFQCWSRQQADELARILSQPPREPRPRAGARRARPSLMTRVTRAIKGR